jgi:G:T-mismatch repair DNA endonuclease (very short patch repair protein)
MEKICLLCLQIFNSGYNKNKKYCSKECEILARSTNLNPLRLKCKNNCLQCNNEFDVLNYKVNKVKFCSRQCYWNYRRDNPEIIIQTNQGDDRVEKICINCNSIYKAHKYRLDSKYCSKICHDSYRQKTLICSSCKKEFVIPIFKDRKYCSEKCAAKGILKRKSKFSQDVFNFLTKLYKCEGEKFERINNKKYFGDIFLPEYNIIIECNGDYWHCNPKIYDGGFFNKKIRKTASEIWLYDKIKYESFQNIGYKIITVWEYDWNNNDNFFNNLKKEIENEICKNKRNKIS